VLKLIEVRLPKYHLEGERSFLAFTFISVGPKGQIAKRVKFVETDTRDVYNLSFGDLDPATGDINDRVVSNNGDTEMVLSTVVSAIYAFTDRYNEAWVAATGSTKARTRLYRIGLSKYLTEIKKDFEIYGYRNQQWQEFEKGIEYDVFLVKRKKLNFKI
jgi:hypothetical protein